MSLDSGSLKSAAERFASLAQLYLDWLDNAAKSATEMVDVVKLHQILAHLQAAAAELPAVEPLTNDVGRSDHEFAWKVARAAIARIPINIYNCVFNPFDNSDNESIKTTLEDDLGDIYADLQDGLVPFNKEQYADAICEWRFSYYNHWGRHLVHAQTALWQWLSEGNN